VSKARRRSEIERIELIRGLLAGAGPPATEAGRVLLGIGDDAAVLAAAGEPLVWTIDCAVEGVHFRRDLMDLEDVGYRATMAAASDLAAMGAAPLGLLASLVLPARLGDGELEALVTGQRAACGALGAAIVGGNLARGGELSITTTALGVTPAPLLRDGARAGDELALAGPVGLAAAGLRLLDPRRRRPRSAGRAASFQRAVEAFRRPLARIEAGLRARGAARAAIDVSDGLAADAGHLARASGVRALIEAEALVTPDLAQAAALCGADPLELALHGGEDYALLIAGPGVGALPGFVRIGRCAARGERETEVALLDREGRLTPVASRGFDHFARARR
jgi:thiamine-monophosphate kinase